MTALPSAAPGALDDGDPGTGDRSLEILRKVRGVFATQGFDGASMQQLARAAGMSAGNFYRYFPSKDAIVAALVRQDLRELEHDFAQVRASADPRAHFRALVRQRVEDRHCEIAPLLLETEAAAMRRPEIARLLEHMNHAVERNLLELLRSLRPTGAGARTDDDLLAHARLIMMLVKGAMRNACNVGLRPLPEAQARALGELVMQTIDAVMAQAISDTPLARPDSGKH